MDSKLRMSGPFILTAPLSFPESHELHWLNLTIALLIHRLRNEEPLPWTKVITYIHKKMAVSQKFYLRITKHSTHTIHFDHSVRYNSALKAIYKIQVGNEEDTVVSCL